MTGVLLLLGLLLGVVPGLAAEQRSIALSVKTAEGEVLPLYADSFALVVGVSDYRQGWPRLPGVREDVAAVEKALEAQGFVVETLLDPERTALVRAIEAFIIKRGTDPNNRLLIYFAGHGHTHKLSYGEEMGFLVPVDAPLPDRDPAGFLARAVDMQQLEVYAKRIQAKHALFVFDSCFSGSIFALSRAVPESISYKTTQPVRQFITSGSADEQVPDESIFRRQFISGIAGEADGNGDGYITGTEFGEFLQDSVVNYSKGSQHPQYGKLRNPNLDKGDFVFFSPQSRKPSGSPGTAAIAAAEAPVSSAAQLEISFWESVQAADSAAMYQAYLDRYPDGSFASLARLRMAESHQQQARSESERLAEEENLYWESVQAAGTPEMFKAYLGRYPDGRFAELARLQVMAAQQAAAEAPGRSPQARLRPAPESLEPLRFSLALLPFRDVGEARAQRPNPEPAVARGALRAIATAPEMVLTHTAYAERNKAFPRVKSLPLDKLRALVWDPQAGFGDSRLNHAYLRQLARQEKLDLILLYSYRLERGVAQFHARLVDVHTGQVYQHRFQARDFWRDGEQVVTGHTLQLFGQFFRARQPRPDLQRPVGAGRVQG